MSNGQAEIERLEAATSAFEEIITTEGDSVEVPNVGPTPSLKKRVEEGLDERVPGPSVYMQKSPSQLDEYGYPDKSLYKNGDGFITYYPEYAVFRKDGGVWEYVTPHLRNVVTFNGITQFATVPRVDEIDLDDPNLEFEVEWYGDYKFNSYILAVGESRGNSDLAIYMSSAGLQVSVGGTFNLTSYDMSAGVNRYNFIAKKNNGTLTVDTYENGVLLGSRSTSASITNRYLDHDMTIGCVNSNAPINFYQGQLGRIKIWTNGDRNTGTLTRDYRMDEGWRGDNNQVLVNYATELGAELVTLQLPHTQPLGDGGVTIGSGAIVGDTYLVSIVTENTEGSSTYGIFGSSFSPNLEGDAPNNISQTKSTTAMRTDPIFTTRAGINGTTITEVSIKQADGYGTYVGLTQASWTQETV